MPHERLEEDHEAKFSSKGPRDFSRLGSARIWINGYALRLSITREPRSERGL